MTVPALSRIWIPRTHRSSSGLPSSNWNSYHGMFLYHYRIPRPNGARCCYFDPPDKSTYCGKEDEPLYKYKPAVWDDPFTPAPEFFTHFRLCAEHVRETGRSDSFERA